MHHPRLRYIIPLLPVVAALAVAAGVHSQATAASAASTTEQQVIASATTPGFRVQVVAVRHVDQSPATATIKVAAYGFSDGTWQRLGNPLQFGSRDAFFWKVVTGPHALRQFSVSNDEPERGTLQLLISPSIGWSSLFRFNIQDGQLVRG